LAWVPTEQDESVDPAVERDLLDMPTAGPSAIRGSLVRTFGYVAGVLLSLISVPLLYGHLGTADFGRYVDVIALVTIVQGITDVGLGQIGVREYVTRVAQRQRMLRNLVGVRIALTSVGVLLATAFAAVVGYGAEVVAGTVVAGVAMVITVAQGTFVIPLAADLRLGWVSALDLLRQALTVAGIVILVLAGASLFPFLGLTVPVAVVVLLATLALVRGAVPMRPSFDRAEWMLLIRAVLPFAAAVAIGTIYLRLTVVMTSLLTTKTQSGYYNLSFTVISVLIAIPALTVGSTLPVIARAARDDRERLDYVLGRLLDVTLIVGVGLGLGLVLGAGFVTHVLTRGKPGAATAVLQIQSIAVVTQFVVSGWQYGLLALHRHRALLIVSAAGLVVSAILTLVLVPVLEARGAAIAFSSGEVAVALLSFLALRLAKPDLRFSLRVPVRVMFAALVGAGAALVPDLTSLEAGVIGGVVYLALLVASRAIPPELLHAVRPRARTP
jgi:O-antigen/teichoic acid export membrane protein